MAAPWRITPLPPGPAAFAIAAGLRLVTLDRDFKSFVRHPTYKDGGAECLGEVPGHSAVKRLPEQTQDLCQPPALDVGHHGQPASDRGGLRSLTLAATPGREPHNALP